MHPHLVWIDYLDSLAPGSWKDGFTCPVCGSHPKNIVADGTSLVCQAKLLPPIRLRGNDDEPFYNTGRYDINYKK